MSVLSLSASLLRNISADMDQLRQIALNCYHINSESCINVQVMLKQMKSFKMRSSSMPKVIVGSSVYLVISQSFHNFELPCFIIRMVDTMQGSIIFIFITWNNAFLILFYKLNSVALVHERTIPTERPPLVGEVSANFCG